MDESEAYISNKIELSEDELTVFSKNRFVSGMMSGAGIFTGIVWICDFNVLSVGIPVLILGLAVFVRGFMGHGVGKVSQKVKRWRMILTVLAIIACVVSVVNYVRYKDQVFNGQYNIGLEEKQ